MAAYIGRLFTAPWLLLGFAHFVCFQAEFFICCMLDSLHSSFTDFETRFYMQTGFSRCCVTDHPNGHVVIAAPMCL